MPKTRRRFALALVAPVLLLAGGLTRPAAASDVTHPYFDDQGTLEWYTTLAEARAAADREGKLIFIEYGRRICTQCKVLCARVLPHPSIRERIGRVAVGLAAECDRPEPAVKSLFRRHLRGARMLPFAGFATTDGRWITGFSGGTSAARFSQHLALAERSLERDRGPARPREPQARTPLCPPRPAASPRAACPPPPVAQESANDECCPGGVCSPEHQPHIKFRPPPILPVPAEACAPRCEPQPPCREPAEPTARISPREVGRFPPPAPLRGTGRSADLAQEPPAGPAIGVGSPDGPDGAALPAPRVRPARPYPGARRSPMTGRGSPDGDAQRLPPRERFVPPTQSARAAALAAAERGEWGEVIRHTRARAQADPELRALNYRAHAWAHERLAGAVRSLHEQRYGDARQAVSAVQRAMQGEPEAIDANRGAEAIELMQDLQHLSAQSPVRQAVRRNAYERLRGSRWAPLFSDCPPPGLALTSR